MTGLVAISSLAGWFALGGFLWTLTGYTAHRFTMHNVGGRGPAAGEHLRHHAQPARTRPLVRVLGHLSMYAIATGLGIAASLIVGRFAAATALGWAMGYTVYEALHHAAHHFRPRGRWDLHLRKRHFHHHFVAPKQNLGVTVGVWDRLFGTEGPTAPIRVPRRLAMPWLLDDNGHVRAEYAVDYVVVGGATPAGRVAVVAEADRRRAFADQAPTPD